MAEWIFALLTLTVMEIVLGVGNVIFIAILAARLPRGQQAKARRVGLAVALVTRLLLLGSLFFLSQLDRVTVFAWTDLGVPAGWFEHEEVKKVSVKDLVLLLG